MPGPTHTSRARSSKSVVGAGQCHWHPGLGFLLHDTAPAQHPVPNLALAPEQPIPTAGPGSCSPTAHQHLLLEIPSTEWLWRRQLLPWPPAAPMGFKVSSGRARGLPGKQRQSRRDAALPTFAAEPHQKPVRSWPCNNTLLGCSGAGLQRPPRTTADDFCTDRATARPPAIPAAATCLKHLLYHAWVKCPL